MSRGVASRVGVTVLVAGVLCGCGDDGTPHDAANGGTSATSAVAQATSTEPIAEIRARRLRKAIASIARHVDVPVMLPSNLPDGVTLSDDPTINNTSSQLPLDLGAPRFLLIEYGVAGLTTCRGFRRVTVGAVPGLMSTSKVRPNGSGKDLAYRTVVWPATPELPQGRYGISGTFSTARLLAFARAMKVRPSFKPRDAESHCVDSIQAGLDFIDARVDVPVVVPRGLPPGTEVENVLAGLDNAQLTLRLGQRRFLTIQYGRAGFDGCGPLHPREVRVAGQPAVIQVSKTRASGKRKASIYTTLVWPATLKELEGRYGLSGPFSAEEMLAFAESMERARAAKPRGPKTNC